ncbi:heterokaryon incompatibility protein [Phlyctema vagabunda]|uniref:Heterokaryon incompatibility protein n=1 Tax=Phlyctema vagabunda TaxID=108571 RepID=A0ABR4PQC1_9HELO
MDYKPLREQFEEIRVVTLLPATPDGLVHCNIDIVSLTARKTASRSFAFQNRRTPEQNSTSKVSERPEASQYRFEWGDYACLSYVWGDARCTTRIIANGIEIQVTTNLEACLQAMQKRAMFGAGFKVWIDAICINQVDTHERGSQVKKMRDIYSVAWSVVIWLGIDHGDALEAISLLERLSRYSDVADSSDQGQRRYPNTDLRAQLLRDPAFLGRGSWIALREFLSRSYWDRLWIIQEIILSGYKTVLCGAHTIKWDVLSRGLGTIHTSLFLIIDDLLRNDQVVCGESEVKLWNRKNLHRIWKDLGMVEQQFKTSRNSSIYFPQKMEDCTDLQASYKNMPLDIHRLLQISNQSLASDARDKFYGLLAIAEPTFARQINPSYDMNAGEVFNMVAKAHIQRYNSLEILREANPWGGNASASWAPDWNWPGRNRFSFHLIPYSASRTTAADAQFDKGNRTLVCRGLIIDKVDGLGPRRAPSGVPWEFDQDTMIQPQIVPDRTTDIDEARLHLACALTRERSWEVPSNSNTWHMEILNMSADADAAVEQFSKLGPGWEFLGSDIAYYRRWCSWRRAHANLSFCGRRLDEYFRSHIPSGAMPNDYIAAYQAAGKSCQGQRLAITDRGRIGWVADNFTGGLEEQVVRGDLFCVLLGCSTPILMRPHLDGFVVLGESYLQGVMEGEVLKGTEDTEHLIQDLVIY